MKYLRNEWDRAGAWLCVTAGAVALVVGYFGVSGTLETGKQLPYVVSGGMAVISQLVLRTAEIAERGLYGGDTRAYVMPLAASLDVDDAEGLALADARNAVSSDPNNKVDPLHV